MAVLDGVDGSDDELGCEEAACVQKGVWEGLPPQEEGYDPVHLLITVTCCVVLKARCSPSTYRMVIPMLPVSRRPAKFGLSRSLSRLHGNSTHVHSVPSRHLQDEPSPLALYKQPYPRHIKAYLMLKFVNITGIIELSLSRDPSSTAIGYATYAQCLRIEFGSEFRLL